MRQEIRIDEEELPERGYSSSLIFEDDNCCVNFGKGNTIDSSFPMASVVFKKLNIEIFGGASFREYIAENQDSMGWSNAALSYFVLFCPEILIKQLQLFIERSHQDGIRKGREEKAEQIRKALGLDGHPACLLDNEGQE